MARQKSASFTGVRIEDADPASPTRKRALRDVCGDLALIHDRVTGQNSHSSADLIDHNGTAGHGALLGIPLWNQYFGRRLTVWASPGPATKDGGEGETNILAVPFFLPGGVSSSEGKNLMLELFVSFDAPNPDALQPHVVIYDDSGWTEMVREPLGIDTRRRAGGQSRLFCDLSTKLTSGGTYVLFVRMTPFAVPDHDGSEGTPASVTTTAGDGTGTVNVGTLHSVCLRSTRVGDAVNAPQRLSTSPFSVWTPASTEGMGHRDFDAGMFADRYAFNARALIGADRNANALIENLRGWPAGGNASYTHIDHDSGGSADSSNPARSRFSAHTRSLYAAEPEIEFPIFIDAFGAFKTDGGMVIEASNTPTYGMLDFYAPWPVQTASQSVRHVEVIWPDFQTASSRLKALVLVGSDGARADVGTDWTASIRTAAGTTACGAFSALDGDNLYWWASASAIAFSSDTQASVELLLEKTAGALEEVQQIVLLGWCVYFDP